MICSVLRSFTALDAAGAEQVVQIQDDEVYVPAWGSYSGINDRFALMKPSGAVLWQGRMDYTLQQCRVEPIHAEVFVKHFSESNGFKVCPSRLLFSCSRMQQTVAVSVILATLCNSPDQASDCVM